jgi:hypothetical protein
MESVFNSPAKVRDAIRDGMKGKLADGTLSSLEFAEIEDQLDPPKPTSTHRAEPTSLKGEGGSGEPKVKPLVAPESKSPPSSKKEGAEVDWEQAEQASTRDEWSGDREEEGRETDGGIEAEVRALRTEVHDLRTYLDYQVQAINQIITPFQSRLQRLEGAASPSIPLAVMEHRRQRSSQGSPATSPPRGHTKSGVGIPKLRSGPAPINKDTIAAFLARNKEYPSLTAVRRAKLKQLQGLCQLPGADIDVGVASWNVEGLVTLLKTTHHE